MQVRRLEIHNFRGIANGTINFVGHTLLIGSNNIGKSTVCEALDLVLGPERMLRRPVIDEHDFYKGRYLDAEGKPIDIVIKAVLTNLSEELERRFFYHLRRWDDATGNFVDNLDATDDPHTKSALPVIFIGQYDRGEDDFIGNTYFDHPQQPAQDIEESSEDKLGGGRKLFGREQKRRCGFLFLRTLRTGSRALSLQRGSLLDTLLRLGGNGLTELWEDTLKRLRGLNPPIGEIEQLKVIRQEISSRMQRFVRLAANDDATAFFASDLTRENLRDVVSLFLSTEPDPYLVPFWRLGTGSVNLLVFALLTFVAELKEKQSVIFAMEEPETALPPHTQRRVAKFILSEMGQAIFTSHSPYIIEQFRPEQIVMLERDATGKLHGRPIILQGIKFKNFRQERRQMAEAILSKAVLVVEGCTEEFIFPLASEIMERCLGEGQYTHFDLAGVTIFNADGEGSIPSYGPFFTALGKMAFAFYDKRNTPFNTEQAEKMACYTKAWELPEKGVESFLVKGISPTILKRFLKKVALRPDYPTSVRIVNDTMTDEEVCSLVQDVLKARKGEGYGALLLAECSTPDEFPALLREVLETIHAALQSGT